MTTPEPEPAESGSRPRDDGPRHRIWEWAIDAPPPIGPSQEPMPDPAAERTVDEPPDRVAEASPVAGAWEVADRPPDWSTPATQTIRPPFANPASVEHPITGPPPPGPVAGPGAESGPPAEREPSEPRRFAEAPGAGPSRRQVFLILAAAVLLLVCFWGAVALTAFVLVRNLGLEIGPGGHRTVGLNQTIRDGNLEFRVRAVECGVDTVGDPLINRTATGQFCLVRLTVRNVGGRPVSFVDAFQQAYGPKGETYQADSVAGILANADQQGFLDVINPGNRVTGELVYDVPPGARIMKLRLRQSSASEGATVRIR